MANTEPFRHIAQLAFIRPGARSSGAHSFYCAMHASSSWFCCRPLMSSASSGNHCRSDPVQVQSTILLTIAALLSVWCALPWSPGWRVACARVAPGPARSNKVHTCLRIHCWAEARIKIARMTFTIKLDGNWSSFQLANSAPPLSVTDSAFAPSARISDGRLLI